jgi:hypothetical protein
MATINQVFSNWNKLNFNKVIKDTMYESEKDIIYLNVEQMQNGKGSDGGILKNNNYKGVYSPITEEIAKQKIPILPKRTGELYNFGWEGNFLHNMDLEVSDLEYKVFSTGTGVDTKKEFFDGYVNMWGLNKESRAELIDGKGFNNKLVKNVKNAVRL